MSASKTRLFVIFSVILAVGHLFDLSLGLGWNNSIGWFGAVVALYATWDPMYVAQPFYMEITSLASGFVMIPMTLAIGWGFHKCLPYVKWLVPMYFGFIICNNIGWYFNEYFSPQPPNSWFMLILCSAAWWILPSVLVYNTIRYELPSEQTEEAPVDGGQLVGTGQPG
jgi:hypothetical protein